MFVHHVNSFNGYAPTGLSAVLDRVYESTFCLQVQNRSLCRTMWLVALEVCFVVYCSRSLSCRSEGHHF